ncbi:hypothetical protein SERLADRAFT_374888 [Serpula lacrymans var. lacrymans S7.9]|uniref:Uncharacterized protein n=1 Tax=Serpula lacrymans var. lacrymans (strain S7.9) TaxID=578457 RepID=F8PDI8_SERL9|nr:uncharacterized protein SERLADRAFT_374888 [Serpula lacrymans var. lacrymans S7.9]EGO18809.1 hypothetical protein SERLADRAFT_374888 [Serpula lacrymans var. lacrymans S7.9]
MANSDKEQENVTMGAFSGTSSHSVEGCDGVAPLTPPLDTIKHLYSLPKTSSITPVFCGVRDLFNGADAHRYAHPLHTPRMDGVRDMYLREGTHVTDTPTFEGLRDMMESLAGYRKSDQEEDSGRTTRSGASAKPRDKGDMS